MTVRPSFYYAFVFSIFLLELVFFDVAKVLLIALFLMIFYLRPSLYMCAACILSVIYMLVIFFIVGSLYLQIPLLVLVYFVAKYIFELRKNTAYFFKIILFSWSFVIISTSISKIYLGEFHGILSGSHNHLNTLLVPFFILSSIQMYNFKRTGGSSLFITMLYFILAFISIYIQFSFTGRTGLFLAILEMMCLFFFVEKRIVFIGMVCVLTLNQDLFTQIHSNSDRLRLFLSSYSDGARKFTMVDASSDVRVEIFWYWLKLWAQPLTYLGLPKGVFVNEFGVGSHNSFIQLHMAGGALFLLLFFTMLVRSIVNFLVVRNFLLIFLLGILIFRAATDSLSNSISISFVFYYIYFYSKIRCKKIA